MDQAITFSSFGVGGGRVKHRGRSEGETGRVERLRERRPSGGDVPNSSSCCCCCCCCSSQRFGELVRWLGGRPARHEPARHMSMAANDCVPAVRLLL